jgi:hypothetical protein
MFVKKGRQLLSISFGSTVGSCHKESGAEESPAHVLWDWKKKFKQIAWV